MTGPVPCVDAWAGLGLAQCILVLPLSLQVFCLVVGLHRSDLTVYASTVTPEGRSCCTARQ